MQENIKDGYMYDAEELEACLEALLFAAGEPLSAERIAQALEIDMFTFQKTVSALAERLAERGGLEIACFEDRYQLVTKDFTAKSVRRGLEINRDIPLSAAAFEVLAITAYRQPVTKSYIEQVRGVDCSAVIANLVQKCLICEKGRLDLPGRPLIYGTTDNFLRCFNINSIEELPDISGAEIAVANAAAEAEDDGQLSITEAAD